MATDLASSYYNYYGLSQADLLRRRGLESIANQQAATLGQQRGQRSIDALSKQYFEGFQPEMAKYGTRGLAGPNVASGIQRKGLERYVADTQTGLGTAYQSMQDELNKIAQQEAIAGGDIDAYMKQQELLKQQQIYDAASALKQYSSY